tara:strand:+ start:1547 stop:2668 length:1122 start_codon:yes stop_codon:yes gene_type:complete
MQDNNMNITLDKLSKIALIFFISAGIITIAYFIKGALFPFIVAIVVSYVLHPFVKTIEKFLPLRSRYPNLAIIFSISIIYLILIIFVMGSLVLLIPPLLSQSTDLLNQLPAFITNARANVESWNQEYSSNIPEQIRLEIDEVLNDGGNILVSSFKSVIERTATIAVHALTLVIGLVVTPIFVFYLLKDRESLKTSFVDFFPNSWRRHISELLNILHRVIGAYVRAQVTLAGFVWIVITVGLMIIGIDYAILLGAFAGIFELIPIIGVWLAFIPTVVIVLSTSPEKILWVIILFGALQLLHGGVITPRIQSFTLKIHPLLVLVAIVIGSEIGGLSGVILGPPIAAAAKEIFKYFTNLNSQNLVKDNLIPDLGEE